MDDLERDECAVPNDAAPLRDALHGIWREGPTVTPGGVSPSEIDVGWAGICRAAQSNRGETLHRIRTTPAPCLASPATPETHKSQISSPTKATWRMLSIGGSGGCTS